MRESALPSPLGEGLGVRFIPLNSASLNKAESVKLQAASADANASCLDTYEP